MHLDASQHNPQSVMALVKYLYSADLKVDPNCVVFLSNCTHFFGLSSNALEHACQELVSQHHCLQVLKAAWKNANENLFRRACKFIDWTTLATLMNGRGGSERIEDAVADDDEDAEGADEEAELLEDGEDAGEEAMEEDLAGAAHTENEDDAAQEEEAAAAIAADAAEDDGVAEAAAPAAAAAASSSSSSSSRFRSSSATTAATASAAAAAAAAAAEDVEMWKAIVAEKANPSSTASIFGLFGKQHSGSANLKRSRATSS